MINIRRDNTLKGEKYYCVLLNPHASYHHAVVLRGGTEAIVKRKIEKQLKKWSEESWKIK